MTLSLLLAAGLLVQGKPVAIKAVPKAEHVQLYAPYSMTLEPKWMLYPSKAALEDSKAYEEPGFIDPDNRVLTIWRYKNPADTRVARLGAEFASMFEARRSHAGAIPIKIGDFEGVVVETDWQGTKIAKVKFDALLKGPGGEWIYASTMSPQGVFKESDEAAFLKTLKTVQLN